jgi:HAD superfamily hydrolase (TIGR01509 family)
MSKAAIFDMDGLLIDSEPLWRKAEIECFKLVNIELTEADCRDTMGYRLNEVIDYWFEKHPWDNLGKETLHDILIQRVIDLVRQEGHSMHGVGEAISLFQSLGFKLAVASSSPYILIKEVLSTLNLSTCFEVVYSAQEEEFGKPHPQVFITTAKKLGVLPENCIVIEDSFHGIIAGKAAKMKVIGIPDGESIKKRNYQAADLLLESLELLTEERISEVFGGPG